MPRQTRANNPSPRTSDGRPGFPPLPITVNEPQKSLVPRWGNIYTTPDEPAQPGDCDRWPDGPGCGNPLTRDLINLDAEFVSDECNKGVQIDYSLGFVKFPPVQVVYRNPDCIPKPRHKEEPEKFPPGTKLPWPTNIEDGIEVTVGIQGKRIYVDTGGQDDTHFTDLRCSIAGYGVASIQSSNPYGNYNFDYFPRRRQVTDEGDVPGTGIVTYYYFYDTNNQLLPAYVNYARSLVTGFEAHIISGKYGHIKSFCNGEARISEQSNGVGVRNSPTFFASATEVYQFGGGFQYVNVFNKIYKVIELGKCRDLSKPPAPPPPPPCEPCMNCCCRSDDDNQADLLALLNKILKEIQKANQRIGSDEYPVTLPQTLISEDEGWLGNLIPNPPKKIENLTELKVHAIKYLDELFGQWEIPIEVKDVDPTKPGDQREGIKLKNLAEATAENFGLNLQSSINSEILINMGARILTEAGLVRQQALLTYRLLEALTDFMGFELKDNKEKVPLSFHPGEEELDKFLKEHEQEIIFKKLSDKGATYKDDMTELRHAASIIRAVFWRKVDAKGDIKKQLIDSIKKMAASADDINGGKDPETGKDDLDAFIEKAEVGFINEAGISDSTHPYGKPFEQRPRIKRIGDTSDIDSDGDNT